MSSLIWNSPVRCVRAMETVRSKMRQRARRPRKGGGALLPSPAPPCPQLVANVGREALCSTLIKFWFLGVAQREVVIRGGVARRCESDVQPRSRIKNVGEVNGAWHRDAPRPGLIVIASAIGAGAVLV